MNDETDALMLAIPKLYLDKADDAYYVAEAIIDSDWLRERDRAVAEKAWDEAAELIESDWFWFDGGRDMNPHRPISVSTGSTPDPSGSGSSE